MQLIRHENHQLVSEEMVVATGLGERATITLPDATKVTLNADSKLTYIPKVYNKKERKIKFSGEGYFEVSKDKERPFLIDAKGLNITVLGTTFDLLVRNNEKTAELSLESGKVMFRSLLSGKFVILNPNQKVVLDQSTGNLVVMKDESQYVAPWTPENTDTDVPRAVQGDPNKNNRVSDRYVENGDYLRLNNLQLGYNLPASTCHSLGISNLRVYIGGERLFTITGYKGYDPSTGSTVGRIGYDYASTPLSRTYMAGIKFSF